MKLAKTQMLLIVLQTLKRLILVISKGDLTLSFHQIHRISPLLVQQKKEKHFVVI